MMSSSGSVNESDCPISRCVASSQPVVQSVADVVMSDVEARTRSAASKVLEEYQEVMQLALTKTSLDEKWTVFEPALEKLAQAKNFELFIDLLVNIKLHDPLVELSPSLKAYLCTDFRLNPEHPLRAVYVLMNQVPGPTFFQVMKSTDLPFPEKIPLRESDSSWTFLDESQDSTGVIHWLNVQVEAALNAPHRRYDTPQSWIDIALFNLCRRTQFLPFHMQIQGRGESACLHHVFVVLYFGLSHLKLKDIKNDLDRFNNQESCREVMEAAPFFYNPHQISNSLPVLQILINDAIQLEMIPEIFTCFAELLKLEKLPPPPIKTSHGAYYFNTLLLSLKPQPYPQRRKVLKALSILMDKNFYNESVDEQLRYEPRYRWHISKLNEEARKSLQNFFKEPISGKFYKFDSEDLPMLIHVFETLRDRGGIVFSKKDINSYQETFKKNLNKDFIE